MSAAAQRSAHSATPIDSPQKRLPQWARGKHNPDGIVWYATPVVLQSRLAPKMSPAQFLILSELLAIAAKTPEDDAVDVRQETLAKRLGMGVSTLIAAIGALERASIIRRKKRGRPTGGQTTCYELLPATWHQCTPVAEELPKEEEAKEEDSSVDEELPEGPSTRLPSVKIRRGHRGSIKLSTPAPAIYVETTNPHITVEPEVLSDNSVCLKITAKSDVSEDTNTEKKPVKSEAPPENKRSVPVSQPPLSGNYSGSKSATPADIRTSALRTMLNAELSQTLGPVPEKSVPQILERLGSGSIEALRLRIRSRKAKFADLLSGSYGLVFNLADEICKSSAAPAAFTPEAEETESHLTPDMVADFRKGIADPFTPEEDKVSFRELPQLRNYQPTEDEILAAVTEAAQQSRSLVSRRDTPPAVLQEHRARLKRIKAEWPGIYAEVTGG